jgi:hypothetical protein
VEGDHLWNYGWGLRRDKHPFRQADQLQSGDDQQGTGAEEIRRVWVCHHMLVSVRNGIYRIFFHLVKPFFIWRVEQLSGMHP